MGQPEIAPAAKPFIIPVFLPHAGCPHQCVFCNQRAITGVQGRFSLESARAEVDRCLGFARKNRGETIISFYGGNFLGLDPADITGLLSMAASYVDRGVVQSIRFSTRPDTVDERRLALLAPFPVATVELGVQSMDDGILQASRRGHTARDSILASALVREKGYALGLQMMTGLPGDEGSQSLETAREIIALRPDFVRIYPTVVLAGSPLAAQWKRGEYTPSGLDRAVALCKELFLLFSRAGIPAARLGLAASESLEDPGAVLAGPYHPAFGHLVASAVMLDKALALLREAGVADGPVTFRVHPRSLSRLRGQNNANVRHLEQVLGASVHTVEDPSLPLDRPALHPAPA